MNSDFDSWAISAEKTYHQVSQQSTTTNQTKYKLPFNPFIFDFSLVIIKSKGHQLKQNEFSLNKRRVILRNAKAQFNEEQIILKDPKVSRSDHCIFQNNTIRDPGSTLGTYVWVDKKYHKKIEANDIFYLSSTSNENALILKIIKFAGHCLSYKINDGVTEEVKFGKEETIFIGSDKNCKIKHPKLEQYLGQISKDGYIWHLTSDNKLDLNTGIWHRITAQANKIKLFKDMIIKIDPFIFAIRY